MSLVREVVCPFCGIAVRLMFLRGGGAQSIAKHGVKVQLPSKSARQRALGIGGRWSFVACEGSGVRVAVVRGD